MRHSNMHIYNIYLNTRRIGAENISLYSNNLPRLTRDVIKMLIT